jgi:hypothetical protein
MTLEVGALLAVMGKYNEDSPRLQKLTAQTMERVIKGARSRCKPDGAGAEVSGFFFFFFFSNLYLRVLRNLWSKVN